MKGVRIKKIVGIIATGLMAAPSLSISLAIADDASSTGQHFFENQIIDPIELERREECCKSCENQQDVPTLANGGDGRQGTSASAQHKVHSLGWDAESFAQSADYHNNDQRVVRILTWAESKPALQEYADLYRKFYPDAPTVIIVDVPSLKELDYEVSSELRLDSTVFDGFVVPPLMMGEMLRPRDGQALAIWSEEEMFSPTPQQQEEKSLFGNLLPYYRYNVATYGGRLRGLPILAGSQALLLFRKDYLDALKLPTPKTWEDWTIIASAFSDQKNSLSGIGSDESDRTVYGACLGMLNEAGCRRRNSQGGRLCKSQTMTYLGMMMASMTQYTGNSTGYMLGMDSASSNGLDPLFQPTLERILKWMEQQIENSTPRSLTEDSFDSMKNFREGRCALTISVDHDSELLKDHKIGFVPLPGSHQVLDRSDTAAPPDSMTNCSATCSGNCRKQGFSARCPYGKDFGNWGRVNQVPFGAIDATVGTVSALVSRDRQEQAKKFFKFVLASDVIQDDTGVGESSYSRTRQPLTYSELEKFDVSNYKEVMKSLTSSPNAAIPFRVPNAFNLLSDLDDRIYDYLADGDYSNDSREKVGRTAERSWNAMISMYDFRGPYKRQPTSMIYELSMGVHVPMPSSDLYIGWVARGIMWILACLSCLGSMFSALWVWTYQQERVIRASQPVFLYLICAGTFVMATSVFTFGIEDDIASDEISSVACMANYWLYALGFTAVISAVFSKMWMLGKVFQKPRNEQRIQITKQDILVPFFVIFGLDCVVLSVWTIMDRYQWVRMPFQNSDPYSLTISDDSTVGLCYSNHSAWYIGLLLLVNFAVLLLSLVQSYECRRITTEYAESEWVTLAIATTAQAWFISLPLFMLLGDNPTTYFILTSSTVLCTTLPILLLIFIPKMIYSYEAMKEQTKVKLTPEETRKQLFDDNFDKSGELRSSAELFSGDFTVGDRAESMKGSSQTASQRRRDPKGTIGIRLVQFSFLDSDEVDELEDAVDFAHQRNMELKDTMGRLKDNLEEHQFARRHLFTTAPRYSFRSKAHNSDRSVITSADISGIIEAKPENLRHNRLSRRDTYMS